MFMMVRRCMPPEQVADYRLATRRLVPIGALDLALSSMPLIVGESPAAASSHITSSKPNDIQAIQPLRRENQPARCDIVRSGLRCSHSRRRAVSEKLHMGRRDLRREADHVHGHAVEIVQRILAGPGVHLSHLHRTTEPAGVEGNTAHRVGDRNSGMIDAAGSTDDRVSETGSAPTDAHQDRGT